MEKDLKDYRYMDGNGHFLNAFWIEVLQSFSLWLKKSKCDASCVRVQINKRKALIDAVTWKHKSVSLLMHLWHGSVDSLDGLPHKVLLRRGNHAWHWFY